MPGDRSNTIYVIVGKKGSGKTTLAKKLHAQASRRITIDPMWEYKDGVIVTTFDDLVSYVRPRRFAQYSVILRTMDDVERDNVIEFLTTGEPNTPTLPNVTILIDEIDRLCSPREITDELHRLVNYGRHYGVDLIAVSRRPRAMHRDITANADAIAIGQTQEPRDVDYLEEFVGPQLVAKARALPEYGFAVWPDDMEPKEGAPDDSTATHVRVAHRDREGSPHEDDHGDRGDQGGRTRTGRGAAELESGSGDGDGASATRVESDGQHRRDGDLGRQQRRVEYIVHDD